MSSKRNPNVVSLAGDNDEGRMLACDALTESRLPNAVHYADGEDSLDYQRSHGKYPSPAETPRPVIVSLDLNLPKMDGREALREIKNDPLLRQNRVLVMNTSKTEEGVFHCFDSGASAYLSKALTSEGFGDVMKSLGRFWFEIVDLPREDEPLPMQTARRNSPKEPYE